MKFNIEKTTKDYKIFKTHSDNRHNRGKLRGTDKYKNLLETIEKNGQIEPIEIGRTGKIIDGATRLMVMQDLGLTVKYIRRDRTDNEVFLDMIQYNAYQRPWSTMDIMNGWAEHGCKPYVDLIEVINITDINVSYMGTLAMTAGLQNIQPSMMSFKEGKLEPIDKAILIKYGMVIKQVLLHKKFSSPRVVIDAFRWSIEHNGYDITKKGFERIASKLSTIQISKIPATETIEKINNLSSARACASLNVPTSVRK